MFGTYICIHTAAIADADQRPVGEAKALRLADPTRSVHQFRLTGRPRDTGWLYISDLAQ